MTHGISDQLLASCSDFISVRYGLFFPKKRWRDLGRGLASAANDLGLADAEPFAKRLANGQLTKDETSALLCRLTIGETYFFREKKSFEALEAHIFPALIDSRRGGEKRLRIWCAGCSTGEEPYSVALLLHRMIGDLAQWNITILASDINPSALRKGADGEYGDWSFRGMPHWIKNRYFKANGAGRFVISGAIRKMVTFAPLNLARDHFPSLANNTNAMDVIFCRNVLMYFAPERIKEVIGKFHQCLVAGGWLVVGPCESSRELFTGYAPVQLGDAIFYRKEGKRPGTDTQLFRTDQGARVAATDLIAAHPPPLAKGDSGRLPDVSAVKSPPAALYQRGMEIMQDSGEQKASPYVEAQALYLRGEYAEAAERLTGFLAKVTQEKAPPAFGEAALLLAQALANQGNLTAALEWSEKGVAADRLNPLPYYLQATIFQERGDYDAAAVSLKKSIYLDQGFVIAHFSLATLFLRRGKPGEAARHLANAASFLQNYGDDDILPGSEGMNARRFAEIIAATRESIEAGNMQRTRD